MARELQRWGALGCCLLALAACTREIKERCRFVNEHVRTPELPAGFAEVDRLIIRRVMAMTQTSRELQSSLVISFRIWFAEETLPILCGRLDRARELAVSSQVREAGMELDPSRAQVFRGSRDFTLKPGETKLDPVTGLVKPSHGLSLDANPASVEKCGEHDWSTSKSFRESR